MDGQPSSERRLGVCGRPPGDDAAPSAGPRTSPFRYRITLAGLLPRCAIQSFKSLQKDYLSAASERRSYIHECHRHEPMGLSQRVNRPSRAHRYSTTTTHTYDVS